MSFAYDSDVEDSWGDLSLMKRNSPALRFDYTLARLLKERKSGPLTEERKRGLVCKVIDQKGIHFDKSKWKFEAARVSTASGNPYLCLCSLPTNRYFILDEASGLKVRVGPECLEKLLEGKELENATRTMQTESIRKGERKRLGPSSRN